MTVRQANLVLTSLAVFVAGCGETMTPPAGPPPHAVDAPELPAASAAKAQTALLRLISQENSPFEGADADRFAEVPLTETGTKQFAWGAFTIDIGNRRYQAAVKGDTSTTFYDGVFRVDKSGEWEAEWPERIDAHEPIPSDGDKNE